MITKFNNGYGYTNNDTITFTASDRFTLSFKSSDIYLNGVNILRITKTYGMDAECFDEQDSKIGTITGFSNVVNFILQEHTVIGTLSFLSKIDELVPQIDTTNVTNMLVCLKQQPLEFSEPLELIFVASSGFTMLGVDMQFTMGGKDVSQFYDSEIKEYEFMGNTVIGTRLFIESVSGDIVITGSATQITAKTITYDLSGTSSTGAPIVVDVGDSCDIVITTDLSGTSIKETTIMMGTIDITNKTSIRYQSMGASSEKNMVIINIPSNVIYDDITVISHAVDNPFIHFNCIGCTPPTNVTVPYNVPIGTLSFNAITGYINEGAIVSATMNGNPISVSVSYGLRIRVSNIGVPTGDVVVNVDATKLHDLNVTVNENVNSYTFARIDSVLAHYNDEDEQIELTLTGLISNTERTKTYIISRTYDEDEKFIGFGLQSSTQSIYIPSDVQTTVSFNEDTNLYEKISVTPVVPTDFHVILYKNNAENNKVDKTDSLVLINDLTGALRRGTTIINPTIDIQMSDVPTFNYVYIPLFNRYYFVTEIVSINTNLWGVAMRCDVLMSHKDMIIRQTGLIARNQYEYNDEMDDPLRLYERGQDVSTIEITKHEGDVDFETHWEDYEKELEENTGLLHHYLLLKYVGENNV